MSPTAEQTEERSQHDEKDGSKRSLRRFSIVVWRLHWKALYLHWTVLDLESTLIHSKYFYFGLRLVQPSLLPVNVKLYIHNS